MKKKLWVETQVDAMVTWCMVNDRAEAYEQINANPDEDLAYIGGSVNAGLASLAKSLDGNFEDFLNEDLDKMKGVSSRDVLKALDDVHTEWREENFYRWLEKIVLGAQYQFKSTRELPFEEVIKDYLFIRRYVEAAGFNGDNLEEQFEVWKNEPFDTTYDRLYVCFSLMDTAENQVDYLKDKFLPKLQKQLSEAKHKGNYEKIATIEERIAKVEAYVKTADETSPQELVHRELVRLGWMVDEFAKN